MDKFWANMIIEGKARFADIKSKYRKEEVKKLLQQYVEENKITQEEYNNFVTE